MSHMKQLGLSVIVATGLALATTNRAVAEDWGTITLTNVASANDKDYESTGQASLSDVTYSYMSRDYASDVYTGHLTLTCAGLTPGATYRIGPIGPYDSGYQLTRKKFLGAGYPYAWATASATGTLELDVQVNFFRGYAYQ
jgi:hypothetical protein